MRDALGRLLPGSDLAKKSKIMEGALRRALAQDNADRLRRACERLLDSAADGESWVERMAALNLLFDRLDGKAKLTVDAEHDGALVVSWVVGSTPSVQHQQPVTIEHQPQHQAAVGVSGERALTDEAG